MEEKNFLPISGSSIDQDLFRQVWERVMPDQSNSPVELNAQQESPSLCPRRPEPVPRPEPQQDQTTLPECTCEGTPPMCLGPESAGDMRRLEELMSMAKWGVLSTQQLARRANGSCAKAMTNHAADHRYSLRRLSTAYFLITGKRFHPSCPTPELPMSVSLALREQFMWEKRWEYCNQQAAQGTQDLCLKALYEELSQEGALHAGTIRSLLEQMT